MKRKEKGMRKRKDRERREGKEVGVRTCVHAWVGGRFASPQRKLFPSKELTLGCSAPSPAPEGPGTSMGW